MIQPTLYFTSTCYFLKDNFVFTTFYNYVQNPQKRFDNSHNDNIALVPLYYQDLFISLSFQFDELCLLLSK